ncbi:MAG: large conductance mechanosensitive channel protein MscL [Geminicoccaceae bacterium]
MIQEFKEFILRGNAFDMAVGIIIGAAFSAVINSLVEDVIMPIVGFFSGGIDFTNQFINLSAVEYDTLQAAKDAGAPVIGYGALINTIITLLIVGFVLFLMVKAVNKASKAKEEEPAAPPEDVVLLGEIRDLLKK